MAVPFDLGAYYTYLAIFVGFGFLIYYFWQLKSMFPVWELKRGGDPVAIFVNMAGQIKLYAIKSIKGRSFAMKDGGTYQLLDDFRYECGKRDVYFYFVGHANPISIETMGKLMSVLRKKKLSALTVKHVKNIAMDENEDIAKELGVRGLQFIDAYYDIDIFARADMIYEASTKKRFTIDNSRRLIPFKPQKALFWRNVLLVSINDRKLDIVKAELSQGTDDKGNPITKIHSEYCDLDVIDAHTRYKKGKTNVFVGAVKTLQEAPTVA